ncbi:MAG TPA: adenosylcobinamide-GDP ribazoletransferase [Beijerinckiaceae bacterium]|jgi:adenosylcobinamide-GDP ribazoletransferase
MWSDPEGESAWREGARAYLADVLKCLRFYSRLPVPEPAWERDPHGPPDFATMPRVVPVAGAVIGLCGAAVLGAAHLLGLGAFLTAALTVAGLTLATGAFHEDGLADAADGLFGGSTPERRLEIMRDSRIGSYGGAALVLAYVLRIAALAELVVRAGPSGAAAAVVLTAALSRSAGLILMILLPPARMAGSSYAVGRPDGGIVAQAWVICAAMGLAAALASLLPFLGVALAFLLATGVAFMMTRLARRLIGGQTGDVGGAVQQLAEIAAYLGLLIAARP